MTAAQKAAKEKFSKAIAYRTKTGVSLKEAFAHVYGKKVGAVKKKTAPKKKAAVKKTVLKKKAAVKKAAPKKKAPVKKVAPVKAAPTKTTIKKYNSVTTVSGLGALPIDFKGSFLGYKFYIVNQYQLDGTVTAQLVEIEGKGNIIASLTGNPKENDRVTAALYSGALDTGKFLIQPEGKRFSESERKSYNKDLSDLEKKIKGFVVNLNKEVTAYNSGKDITKKKSKGLKIVYKPETKKLSVVEEIKTILKNNKKILKGGYTLKTGVIREKKY